MKPGSNLVGNSVSFGEEKETFWTKQQHFLCLGGQFEGRRYTPKQSALLPLMASLIRSGRGFFDFVQAKRSNLEEKWTLFCTNSHLRREKRRLHNPFFPSFLLSWSDFNDIAFPFMRPQCVQNAIIMSTGRDSHRDRVSRGEFLSSNKLRHLSSKCMHLSEEKSI